MDGVPTEPSEPLEETIEPVTFTGGEYMTFLVADCGTAQLAAATAWVPEEASIDPDTGDSSEDTSAVDGLPSTLSRLMVEPAGLWRAANDGEVMFMAAVSAASHPGQSQDGGGSMYLSPGRGILAQGSADMCCSLPSSGVPSYLGKGLSRGEYGRNMAPVMVWGRDEDSSTATTRADSGCGSELGHVERPTLRR